MPVSFLTSWTNFKLVQLIKEQADFCLLFFVFYQIGLAKVNSPLQTRALLLNKKLLLVDEANANLDKINAKKIRDLLLDLPVSIIEVAHHYYLNDPRYTAIYELKNGKLVNIKTRLAH